MSYLNASPLQEVFTDVSLVVLQCVLVDELIGHDGMLLLKTPRTLPLSLLLDKTTKGNLFPDVSSENHQEGPKFLSYWKGHQTDKMDWSEL